MSIVSCCGTEKAGRPRRFKILKGKYSPMSPSLSKDLKDCIKALLSTNPAHRPTLMELLHLPVTESVKALAVTIQVSRHNTENCFNCVGWAILARQ